MSLAQNTNSHSAFCFIPNSHLFSTFHRLQLYQSKFFSTTIHFISSHQTYFLSCYLLFLTWVNFSFTHSQGPKWSHSLFYTFLSTPIIFDPLLITSIPSFLYYKIHPPQYYYHHWALHLLIYQIISFISQKSSTSHSSFNIIRPSTNIYNRLSIVYLRCSRPLFFILNITNLTENLYLHSLLLSITSSHFLWTAFTFQQKELLVNVP